MRARFVVAAIALGFLAGCSLVVSLDGLADGDASSASLSDASPDQIAVGADSSSDATSSLDAGSDASPYATAILADSPLAYFHFDEASGTTLHDSSGHGHDATTATATLGGAGAFAGSGTSAHFDGNAFISIADSVNASGTAFDFAGHAPFTYEAWVKIDRPTNVDAGEEFTFFSKEQYLGSGNFYGTDFFIVPNFVLQREDDPTDETEVDCPSGIADNNWHYLVGTFDGVTSSVYFDNVLIGSHPSGSTSLQITNVPSLFGAESTEGNNGMVGSMDEAAIYTTSLTSAQRTAHYQAAGH
jgi:hypothetical protein